MKNNLDEQAGYLFLVWALVSSLLRYGSVKASSSFSFNPSETMAKSEFTGPILTGFLLKPEFVLA
jgi:hypothetical protein